MRDIARGLDRRLGRFGEARLEAGVGKRMPTVVIIHAGEDTLPARALAEKLRQAKLEVVLEHKTSEELRAATSKAAVSIALWSPRSVDLAGLIEEVAQARSGSKILHARMQNAETPAQFRGDKSVNLTGWRGEDDFAAWRELAKLVTDKAGVKPLPPPVPKAPSGFFQPGRPATAGPAPRPANAPAGRAAQAQRAAPPRAAAQRPGPAPAATSSAPSTGGRGMILAVVGALAVAVIGGGGYFFWARSQGAETTSAAWENVERTDASALRAFIDGDPGDFRDDAEAALAELEVRTFEAASDADSVEALEAFLNDFPDSEHALAVRGRIAELTSVQLPPTTESAPEAGATDPDLVPPAGAPEPGPAPITPPATPAPEPAPVDAPTN